MLPAMSHNSVIIEMVIFQYQKKLEIKNWIITIISVEENKDVPDGKLNMTVWEVIQDVDQSRLKEQEVPYVRLIFTGCEKT